MVLTGVIALAPARVMAADSFFRWAASSAVRHISSSASCGSSLTRLRVAVQATRSRAGRLLGRPPPPCRGDGRAPAPRNDAPFLAMLGIMGRLIPVQDGADAIQQADERERDLEAQLLVPGSDLGEIDADLAQVMPHGRREARRTPGVPSGTRRLPRLFLSRVAQLREQRNQHLRRQPIARVHEVGDIVEPRAELVPVGEQLVGPARSIVRRAARACAAVAAAAARCVRTPSRSCR